MGKFLKLILTVVILGSTLCAQNIDLEVARYIKMIESGEMEKVINEAAKIIKDNPNHPAILYLQGRLSSDGIEALKFYQAVVDNFSKSEWADDALYKIYQYYYAVGLYKTADLKWKHLQKEYPNSPYLKYPISKDIKPIDDTIKINEIAITHPDVKVVEQLKDDRLPLDTQKENTKSVIYTVQVGAFSTLENAKKQEKFFVDLGYQVEVTNRIRAGKSLYLVWVGNFNSTEEAEKVKDEIKHKYRIESITIQKY